MPLAAFATPSGSARSRLLSRKIGERGRRDRRGARQHREDTDVLRAQAHANPARGRRFGRALIRPALADRTRGSIERVLAASVSHPDLIFLNAVRARIEIFRRYGEMENDREARSPCSAARNIVELGRRQQPQSARAARPRSGGKNVLAMPCDRQKWSKSAHWRPYLSCARSPTRSGFFYGAAARRADGRPSRYADVSFHARRRACVPALSEVHSGAVSAC